MANKLNDLERRVSLENASDETVELVVDELCGEMRVQLSVPAYVENGVVKSPRRWIDFTAGEWDALVSEVERCRRARAVLGLSV